MSLVHLDALSQITDRTLEARKQEIPMAEAIIEEVRADFNSWMNSRKFAPTIKALKAKLHDFATSELELQRRKNEAFNDTQAELVSSKIIQKITNHVAHHLKEGETSPDESIALIQKVFRLQPPRHA